MEELDKCGSFSSCVDVVLMWGKFELFGECEVYLSVVWGFSFSIPRGDCFVDITCTL